MRINSYIWRRQYISCWYFFKETIFSIISIGLKLFYLLGYFIHSLVVLNKHTKLSKLMKIMEKGMFLPLIMQSLFKKIIRGEYIKMFIGDYFGLVELLLDLGSSFGRELVNLSLQLIGLIQKLMQKISVKV